MLGVGLDWSEGFHVVALGRPEEGVIEQRRVEHTPSGVAALIARIAALEPDPPEVRVVLETRHGLLVEALVDAGYTVLPVNPDLIARRRAGEEQGRRPGRPDRLPAGAGPAHRSGAAGPARGAGRRAALHRPRRRPAPPATSGGCSTGCAPT